MNKVCTQESTGKFIMAMTDHEGVVDTLTVNAVNMGYDPKDLSFTVKTDAEVQKIVAAVNANIPAAQPQPTLADILAVLPQESKDALTAKGLKI